MPVRLRGGGLNKENKNECDKKIISKNRGQHMTTQKVASTTADVSGSQHEDDNAKREPLKHNSEKNEHETEEEKENNTNVSNGNDHNVLLAKIYTKRDHG